MKQSTTLVDYEARVSRAMTELYDITWHDASGETELLAKAIEADRMPEEFVRWFGERYDLEPREPGF
jgi:hypothetical protein